MTGPPITGSPIKVVVVDDDEFDRYVARRVMKKEARIGAVGECVGGSELIELLQSPDFAATWGPCPPPLLVFLDINMPGLSGFETLEQLGATPSSIDRSCIVLMLTSSISERDRARAESFPVVAGYLEKPIDNAKLGAVLAEIYPTTTGPDTAS